ncbi:unnamed protein product [Calypogeia fissa]
MSEVDDSRGLVPTLELETEVNGDIVKTSSAEEANESSSDSDDASAYRLEESGMPPDKKPSEAELRILKGKKFHSWEEFDIAMDEYEATSGFVVKRMHRNKLVFRGRCRGWSKDNPDSCKMELVARLMKRTGTIMIRKVYLTHTCVLSVHKFRNGANRARWVQSKVFRSVKVNRDTPVEQLRKELAQYHKAESESWTVARARAGCREKLADGHKESFQRIPSYAGRLSKADPGVHVEWETGEDHQFERIYISPSSSQHVFHYCRRLVGIDGTHTIGDFPMVVLIATCFDGDDHTVVLAWAIVPVENEYNWTWFLNRLGRSYPSMALPETVFISDRDKGLVQAVETEFPGQLHAYCVQHIKANSRALTDQDAVTFFNQVVASKTKEEYDELLADFVPKTDVQSALVPYLRKIDPAIYVRYAFPARRWGHTTSNVAEVINSVIKPQRKLPALLICDAMWQYCMEEAYKRRLAADQLPEGDLELTNYATEMLNRLYVDSRAVRERTSSHDQALMIDRTGNFALRVNDKHCDCMDWHEMEFPCAHLITFESNRGNDVRQHASGYWRAANYKETYKVPIPPVSIDHLSKAADCKEPMIDPAIKEKRNKKKQIPGLRQKRKRLPGTSETSESERGTRKQNQKCTVCKKAGHNQRRCMEKPLIIMPIETETEEAPALEAPNIALQMTPVQVLPTPMQIAPFYSQPSTQSYADWCAERDKVDDVEAGPSHI